MTLLKANDLLTNAIEQRYNFSSSNNKNNNNMDKEGFNPNNKKNMPE